MSRHRGAKHHRRYELLGGISLLSPEYLLSVERWPFHSEPPDHYVLLSHLFDVSVSQSSTLMPLHYQHDFRPCLAYRSEEHTSELQSRPHLVCRLLLEKKK